MKLKPHDLSNSCLEGMHTAVLGVTQHREDWLQWQDQCLQAPAVKAKLTSLNVVDVVGTSHTKPDQPHHTSPKHGVPAAQSWGCRGMKQ